MAENLHNGFIVKREVEVVVSPQAIMLLKHTGFTQEQFVDWVISKKKVAFGGGDVIDFISDMDKVK